MLTLEDLKKMEPHKIFEHGVIRDDQDGINMTGSGEMLRWVAVRGGIHDWAIYYGQENETDEWISRQGDKVIRGSHIRKLVSCNNEALSMYRY